jgi:flagellar basal-body rod modification protein FlgD
MASTPSVGTQSLGSATSASDASATPPVNPLGQLGKDDFLKLLAAQLQHQDPSNPMDDKEFMGQMAQFATLEQVTNMAQGLDSLSQQSQISQSVGLIGHTIGYVRSDGSQASGTAESVSVQNGTILIKVGDDQVSPGDVFDVGGTAPTTTDTAISGLQDAIQQLAKDTGSTP